MRDLDPDRVERALQAHQRVTWPALPGRTNHRRAGVLVPLRWVDGGGLQVLVTLRPARMRRHADEIVFPGGRPEPGDLDLQDTALRETREEVGVGVRRVLGRLSSTPLYTSDFRLEPFVGELTDEPIVADPHEVAAVFELSVPELLAQPFHHAIAFESEGHTHLSRVYPVGEHVMYGATAIVLTELLTVLGAAMGRDLPAVRTGRYAWQDLPAFR